MAVTRTEKLTNTTVARLAYAHQQQFYIVRDTEVGGFYIRVTATSKVYKYNCDVTEAGKRVTRGFTIGTSAAMTADAARLEVEKHVMQRKQGTLPKLTKSELSPAKTGITLGEAWVQFKDASIKEGKKPRTIAFYELVIRTHLKPWLDTPLKNITRSMVKELHGKISEKHRARANQVIVTGGAVYTFARADLEEVDLPLLSPWRGRKLFNKIKPRQTGLAAASLPDWWCKVDRLNAVLREANLLGILTGLRKENLIALRWDQINIKNRYISIDPVSMKSGEPFKLPMSRAMVRCLWRARKGSRMLHEVNSRTWVFASDRSRSGHISARDLPALLLQRVGRFVLSSALHRDYLFLWINSPHFTAQIDPGRSNGVPHISSKQVEAAIIFVPPLAEQHRIVAKVDALMALYDRLEASLTATAAIRRRLLDALLAEALAPAEDRELEAAE